MGSMGKKGSTSVAAAMLNMLPKLLLVDTRIDLRARGRYIRGRRLEGVFFIIDEAQNLTPHEARTIITRAGGGTKIVFTGDLFQIDSPYLDSQSNGVASLVDRMRAQDLFAHVQLVEGERSALAELASDLP